MNKRGRPPVQDILTPREYEVLDLIRAGLSNRDIAERLGISLAGAKFHVSEIISKLGVESREAAAAWRPEHVSRRWAFLPSGLGLSGWRDGLLSVLSPRFAVTMIAGAFAVATIGAGIALGAGGGGAGEAALAAASPTPTPISDLCAGYPERECISLPNQKVQLASISEAADHTSFKPLLPSHIPDGFERASLTYIWPGEIADNLKDQFDSKGPRSPHEILYAEYDSSDGGVLFVNQGFGMPMYEDTFNQAPEDLRGKVTKGDREVFWYRGNQAWETVTNSRGLTYEQPKPEEWEDSSRITVFWQTYGPSMGTGWEIDPDGTKRVFELRGRPFVYLIFSESLSLDELLKVAASVP